MDKLQIVAQIQAYTAVGIGLMIGLGALGECVGVGSMCARFLEGAARPHAAGHDYARLSAASRAAGW